MDSKNSPQMDAIQLLKQDHKEVATMFERFMKEGLSDEDKRELAKEICEALKIHSQVEKEILYPAARKYLDKDDLSHVDEAEVEHGSIDELISNIEYHKRDELFEAQVWVLNEYVKHHVNEEESELFPKLSDANIDLKDLGKQIAERKEALKAGIIQQTKEWVKSKISAIGLTSDESD